MKHSTKAFLTWIACVLGTVSALAVPTSFNGYYTTNFDAMGPTGTAMLTARATDNDGATTTSAAIGVNVVPDIGTGGR